MRKTKAERGTIWERGTILGFSVNPQTDMTKLTLLGASPPGGGQEALLVALHATTHALHTKPFMLQPSPYPLHATAFTLHPTPYPMHAVPCVPYTPHATLYMSCRETYTLCALLPTRFPLDPVCPSPHTLPPRPYVSFFPHAPH